MFRLYNALMGGLLLQNTKGIIGKLRRLWQDKRERRFLLQRWEDGFSDDDTWSLDYTIAKFVLPRLERFREIDAGQPGGLEPAEWRKILNKIIYAMEKIASEEKYSASQNESDKIQEGCKLFGKWFQDLWW